jgi:hypothetical protein
LRNEPALLATLHIVREYLDGASEQLGRGSASTL